MFNFFRKKSTIEASGLLVNFVDIHSHILPLIDDGSRSLASSLKMLEAYEQLGVKRVIFTPHIMEDFPANNSQSLRREFDDFKLHYKGGIEISLAAEYMLDAGFERHLDSGDLLTLQDNYVLVESSYMYPPSDMIGVIKRVMSKGFFVVLAHPERYRYMEIADYEELKNIGVLFQLNILSILGRYGSDALGKAKFLLKHSMYDFMGTDIHRLEFHINELQNTKLNKKYIDQMQDLKSRCQFK